MSLAGFVEHVRSYWTQPQSLRDPALIQYFGGSSVAGVTVSEWTALNCSAVWAAVQIIAGSISSLPLFHYKRRPDGGKDRYVDSKLYKVLHDEFNPEMSAMIGRETMQAHVLLWGNAYAEIQRNDLGQVVALWPIEPNRVQPFRDPPGGPLHYRLAMSDGRTKVVEPDRILHIPGLGFDGIMGYSVVRKARESIGMQLASERLGVSFFERGTAYSGFFLHPKALGDTALKHLKESIDQDRPGSYRILEEGMTFAPGSMPMRDAQFLETRKFQVTEIARWFNIPPDKLRDLERATFSNIEQQSIDFVVYTLRPWLVRWEQELNRKCIPLLERKLQFCEHLVNGLLRGDIVSRYNAYAIGRNGGWLSANDILEYENENPIPGGDVYLVQGAMVPLDRLNEVIDKQVEPTPAPVTPDPPADRNLPLIEKIVSDLKAEVVRRQEALATDLDTLRQAEGAHHEALVAALPAAPEPVVIPPSVTPEQLAETAEGIRAALEQADEARAATLLAAMQAEMTTLREADAAHHADVVERMTPPAEPPVSPDAETLARIDAATAALPAELAARLATDRALRDWQQATIAMIAGRMVRREMAQIKRVAADPETAAARLDVFYTRFVSDGAADLRPWLLRIRPDAGLDGVVVTALTEWAQAARVQCAAAMANGGLEHLVRGWAVGREDSMTRVLLEAIHGE